jgi:hypothetical protein
MKNCVVSLTVTVCSGLLSCALIAQTFLRDEPLVAKVQKRVHELQPTREEKRFDEIGWAPSILEAEKIARKLNRPIFMFTYDGKIETGRCWGGAFALRAGPLSNPKIIELLNKYYVPVTTSNVDTGDRGTGLPAERTERFRIYGEFLTKKLGVGDVHVYILAADATAIVGMDIGPAMDSRREIEVLSEVVARLHTEPGPPAVTPHRQSLPPPTDADSMIFHLVSRHLPVGGGWNEYPAENWIVLKHSEWAQLLPTGDIRSRMSWDIPLPVAVKLAEWVYPQTEEVLRENRSRVEIASLHFTLTALQQGVGRARIDGRVRLQHSPYPGRPSEVYADAKLLGYMDFDLAHPVIQRMRLVTTEATYATSGFGTSIVSVSRESLDRPEDALAK